MSAETSLTSAFSSGESKLLLSMLAHLKGDINTNWELVANDCGYKDISIAKTRWGQIKRKRGLGTCTTAVGAGNGVNKVRKETTPKKRKTKGGKKDDDVVKSDDEEDGADSGEIEVKSSPVKSEVDADEGSSNVKYEEDI